MSEVVNIGLECALVVLLYGVLVSAVAPTPDGNQSLRELGWGLASMPIGYAMLVGDGVGEQCGDSKGGGLGALYVALAIGEVVVLEGDDYGLEVHTRQHGGILAYGCHGTHLNFNGVWEPVPQRLVLVDWHDNLDVLVVALPHLGEHVKHNLQIVRLIVGLVFTGHVVVGQ